MWPWAGLPVLALGQGGQGHRDGAHSRVTGGAAEAVTQPADRAGSGLCRTELTKSGGMLPDGHPNGGTRNLSLSPTGLLGEHKDTQHHPLQGTKPPGAKEPQGGG